MSEERSGWFRRLREGLRRTSSRLGQGITDLLGGRRLDAETLGELEEFLITADLGVAVSAKLVERLRARRFEGVADPTRVREELAAGIALILAPVERPFTPDPARKPTVVLVAGVNGSGKTTTIGKLGKLYRDRGLAVTLAAGDTFRAAAVEQLRIWGQRTGCAVQSGAPNADAAGVVYDALDAARRRADDLLLIDTAGRLHNKAHLMAELQKVVRVIRKLDPEAPHETLLVLDATVGQNAHNQVETFQAMAGITGLAMTKLDGTAKGGVLVGLAERFGIPVRFVGIGEGADDLRPFEAEAFARGLLGLE